MKSNRKGISECHSKGESTDKAEADDFIKKSGIPTRTNHGPPGDRNGQGGRKGYGRLSLAMKPPSGQETAFVRPKSPDLGKLLQVVPDGAMVRLNYWSSDGVGRKYSIRQELDQ